MYVCYNPAYYRTLQKPAHDDLIQFANVIEN